MYLLTLCKHRTVYKVHRTVYKVHRTVYTVHRTVYTVHRTVYTVHRTVYKVHVFCGFIINPLVMQLLRFPVIVLIIQHLLGVLYLYYSASLIPRLFCLAFSHLFYYVRKKTGQKSLGMRLLHV